MIYAFIVFKGLIQEPVAGFKLEGEAIDYCHRMDEFYGFSITFHYKKVSIV